LTRLPRGRLAPGRARGDPIDRVLRSRYTIDMAPRAVLVALALGALTGTGCAGTTQVVTEQFHLPPGGDVARGKQAFVDLGCARCHAVQGQPDLPAPTVRPPVDVVLGGPSPSRPTDARLVTAIIHPSHQISEPWKDQTHVGAQSRMRPYNEYMTVQQLLDMVAFLRSAEAG